MKTWKIPVVWQEMGVINVEANTLAEAIEIARDDDEVIPIPDNGEFVSGTWELYSEKETYLRRFYNNNQEDEIKTKQKFNISKNPKTFEYVLERDTFTKRCNKCGSPVLKSDVEEYSYQCMACDEDLYEFETHAGEYHTTEELDELCCNTRDLLLLDD